MSQEIKVLILEDVAADAEIVERELRKGGITAVCQNVSNKESYEQALNEFVPDLILSDYNLPSFTGLEALKLARKKYPFVPFILITGVLGDQKAAEIIKKGATDYLLKDQLAQLAEVVKRALEEQDRQIQLKESLTKLAETTQLYENIVAFSPLGIAIHREGKIEYVNPAGLRLLGAKSLEQVMGMSIVQIIHPDYHQIVADRLRQVLATGKSAEAAEEKYLRLDGTPLNVEVITSGLMYGGKQAFQSIINDVTERNRMVETLRQSEARFRAIFNATFQFTGLLTTEGIMIEANQTALDFIGAHLNDVVGRPFWETPWWTGDEARIAKLREAVRKAAAGEFVRQEVELTGKDGKTRVFDFSLTPKLNEKGKMIFLVPEARDISLNKEIEKALKESEEKFRGIAEFCPNMIFINLKGKVVYVNNKCTEVLGYSKEEFLSPTFDFMSLVAPQDRGRIQQIYSQRVNGGEMSSYEYKLVKKNGESLDAINSAGIIRFSGETALLGIVTDISVWKKTEEEKRKAEEKYRNVLATAIEGVWFLDLDFRTTEVNDSIVHMLGYSREELIGKPFSDLVIEAEKTNQAEEFERRKQGQGGQYERQVRCKDGTLKWLFLSAKPMRGKSGEYLGSFALITDITERKRIELALRESEERIRSITNNLSAGMVYQARIAPDGTRKITYVSDSVRTLYGCTPEEALADANKIYGRMHPDDLPRVQKEEEAASRSLSTFKTVARVLLPNGGIRWASYVSVPKKMPDGSTLWDGLEFDITDLKRSKDEVQKSEQRYRSLFETSPAGIFTIEPPAWNITSANPMALSLFQAKNITELLGFFPWQLSPKLQPDGRDSLEKAKEMIDLAMRRGSNTFEWMHRRIGGEVFPAEVYLTLIKESDRVFLQSIVRDITDRKKAEYNLDEDILLLEKLNQMAVELSELPLEADIFELIPKQIMGLTGAVAASVSLYDSVKKSLELKHFQSAFKVVEFFKQALGQNIVGLSVPVDQQAYQYMMGGQGISGLTDLTGLSFGKIPKVVSDNFHKLFKISGFYGLSFILGNNLVATASFALPEGITEIRTDLLKTYANVVAVTISRRTTELSLQESELQYRQIVELSPEAVAIHSDGKIVFINSFGARLMGATHPDEIIGRPVLSIVHPDSQKLATTRIKKMLATGEPGGVVEEKFVRLDGSIVYVEVGAAPLTYKGKPAVMVLCRDVSDKKNVDKMKEDFINMVSHELRTPLAIMQEGLNQTLEGIDGSLNSDQGKTIEMVLRNSNRLKILVDQLLDLEKMDAGGIQLLFRQFDVNALARQIVDDFKIKFEKKLIELQAKIPPGEMIVNADAQRLGEIVVNLLSNALKFTEKGSVCLEILDKGDSVQLIVADTGRGIPDKYHSQVFGRFEQFHKDLHLTERGTGLGLAIVKSLVELHGGSITFESKEGVGTKFVVTIPKERRGE